MALPATLTWPAAARRSYDILSMTNLSNFFQPSATIIPATSAAHWTDSNPAAVWKFYRVRASN